MRRQSVAAACTGFSRRTGKPTRTHQWAAKGREAQCLRCGYTRAEVNQRARAWERNTMLTLSGGSIWRYYNGSDLWECLVGPLRGCFGHRPTNEPRRGRVRGDGETPPLTPEDQAAIKRVRAYANGFGVSPAQGGRADG